MDSEHIYIYGAGSRGIELLKIIKSMYSNEVCVDGFVDMSKVGQVEGCPIYKTENIKDFDKKIVISIYDFESVLKAALSLKETGFTAVYWYNVKCERSRPKDFFAEQCVWCGNWSADTLPHVELHVMDACNLNCVGCTHFSPIFEKTVPDTESRLKDIQLLGRKIDGGVVNFFLMGGEPFLNPNIDKYIHQVKEVFSDAAITVVTNGLLIPKLSPALLRCIGNENVCVSISEYAPTHAMMSQIVEILHDNNIVYNTRGYEGRQRFNKPLSLRAGSERYCISEGCINIWNGKIARCPTLLYITELNRRFELDFPEEGIMDMESGFSGIELKTFLKQEVPLCDYCIRNEIEWQTCGGNVTAEQFVKMN